MTSSFSTNARQPLSDSNGQNGATNGGNANSNSNGNNIKLRPRPPPDPSVLRPSIAISVTGMRQAIMSLENGTPEVRNYLLHECNIIYECKTCFNMFRSLANFIAHKRSYCQSRYQDVKHVYGHHYDDHDVERPLKSYSTMAYVEPEPVDTIVPEPEWDIHDYSPSLSLLKEAGFIDEIASKPMVTELKKPDLNSIVKRLKRQAELGNEDAYYKRKQTEALNTKDMTLNFEKINQTNNAVFQTVSVDGTESRKTMGQKYVEMQKERQQPSVMVGPDGRIIHPGKISKTVSSPDSSKENRVARLRYPCPICKNHYSKVMAVLRHLTSAHQKTLDQANNYRPRIKQSAFYSDIQQEKNIKCEHCGKIFLNTSGKISHEKTCKMRKQNQESLIHILNNQPVIVLHKLDYPFSRSPTPEVVQEEEEEEEEEEDDDDDEERGENEKDHSLNSKDLFTCDEVIKRNDETKESQFPVESKRFRSRPPWTPTLIKLTRTKQQKIPEIWGN